MSKFFKLMPVFVAVILLSWGGYGVYAMVKRFQKKPESSKAPAVVPAPAAAAIPTVGSLVAVKDLVTRIRGYRITGGFLTEKDEVIKQGMETSLGFVEGIGKDFVEVLTDRGRRQIFVETWETVVARWAGQAIVNGALFVSSDLGVFQSGKPSPIGGLCVTLNQRIAEVRYDDGGGVVVRFDTLPAPEVEQAPISSALIPPILQVEKGK